MNHAQTSEVRVVFVNCDAAVYIFANAENEFEGVRRWFMTLSTVYALFFALNIILSAFCFISFPIWAKHIWIHFSETLPRSEQIWLHIWIKVSAFFGETLSAVCCVAVGDSVRHSTEVQQSKTFLIGAQPSAPHSLKRQSPAKPAEHFLFSGCCFQSPH